ncbi:2OG-Fe(II) oxygenase [Sphingomonas yabuuchiae]|uniref:2OG-Fe(II) oxygenase n=2 Tax=Sphingomonas yabuuchiae TaxID=172044 RepID=A0AA41DEC4_9SPHN|nr:2OG-Fe(II) oxygenase [Sphingomonas yabuuchiae]MBB4611576.1 hypothetical protein [Sphingomonas yabuuchiae]MBN3556960.1 2OG-Fe(II) oxygenase [Sphingomonas yabuuchiae]
MDQQLFASAILDRLRSVDIEAQWRAPGALTATRYAVVDDLLPAGWATEISAAFERGQGAFSRRASFRERKSTSSRFDILPPLLADITYAFQQPEIAQLIATQTGIAGMTGDPTLYAGGLSVMQRGDFLNPHIDNSHEATRTRYRRLNLLFYVTPDFPDGVGGNLELWDDRVRTPETIHSRFNRLVVMETNRHSWHSVSPIIADVQRQCVSNYYFSPASPEPTDYYHVTSFTGRPGQHVRRAAGAVDNRARQLARHLGARRVSDQGFRVPQGESAKC